MKSAKTLGGLCGRKQYIAGIMYHIAMYNTIREQLGGKDKARKELHKGVAI